MQNQWNSNLLLSYFRISFIYLDCLTLEILHYRPILILLKNLFLLYPRFFVVQIDMIEHNPNIEFCNASFFEHSFTMKINDKRNTYKSHEMYISDDNDTDDLDVS
jgi:hypothetical protein